MKIPVLAAMACLALPVLPAVAAQVTFNATGALNYAAVVDYAVPVAGQYTITAVGAKGGDGVVTPLENGGAGTGGLGAEAGGTFFLTQGEMLRILVGAAGSVTNFPDNAGFAGSGGGGSFVAALESVGGLPYLTPVPLVAAGGGGGGGAFAQGFAPSPGYNGGDALIGPDGGDAADSSFQGGGGGHGGYSGRGGMNTPFGSSGLSTAGLGFDQFSFPPGLGLGTAGGGGGGASYGLGPRGSIFDIYTGGGGGGLTSKLGVTGFGAAGGGGGGSFTAGADPFVLARIGTGDGFVTITPSVAVPEPEALALFGMGLFGLCAVRQARRR